MGKSPLQIGNPPYFSVALWAGVSMSMITVCQVDKSNVVMGDAPYTRQVPCQGHLQVLVALPEIPAGHTAQWSTTLDPVADTMTWGTEGTGTWETPEDHRKDTLWTGYQAQYTMGSEVEGQTYDGLGPVPAWLFTTEPEIPLATAQAKQTALMYQGYNTAVTQPVSFETAAGVTQTFDADANSQNILLQASKGYEDAGAVPAGFYWVAADNTQVAFTLADLKGLYQAMLAQGWTAFQRLQDRKTSIRAPNITSAAVQAIVW